MWGLSRIIIGLFNVFATVQGAFVEDKGSALAHGLGIVSVMCLPHRAILFQFGDGSKNPGGLRPGRRAECLSVYQRITCCIFHMKQSCHEALLMQVSAEEKICQCTLLAAPFT